MYLLVMNWAEKYRPKTLDDIYISSDTKQKIKKWINEFGIKKKKFNNCLILHGPPGIGKTCLANIILNNNDYDLIEFNSSDIRNQKILKEKIEKINGNVNILNFMCNKIKKIGIIIDELDGISNEKGALKELTSIINNTKKYSSPFICTTNTMSKKIDTLKKKSLYIKINTPGLTIIKQFINKICNEESLEISKNVKEAIAKNSQLDFRRVVVLMEYLFNYKHIYDEDELLDTIYNYDKKNIANTSYEATDKLLNTYYKDVSPIVEIDKSTIGYLFYENFTQFIIQNKTNTNKEKLKAITTIYNNFLDADILDNNIYIKQYFYLNNYNNYIKFNIPMYILNNLKKTSYNKYNKINYSTMINKISFEYLNLKLVNNINDLHIFKHHIYTSDYLYSLLKYNKPQLNTILETYNIDKIFLEKICKLSSFYSKDTNLKKMIE